MRKIDKIVLHVSDSPDSRAEVDATTINAWHLERGFTAIGYHAVALRGPRAGTVELGRPESTMGAHCVGHNKGSLALCWVGRDHMDLKQEAAVVNQLADWCVQYNLPETAVYGHRELAPMSGKTCPNVSMSYIRTLVASRIRALKGN